MNATTGLIVSWASDSDGGVESESNDKKEDAKNKYNDGNVQVLLISKAGTEGVDTVATESIFIFEGSQWNESLTEQATARAVRFMSHYHLPKEHQKVWVYRLLVIKKSDEELIKKINEHKIFNFAAINKNFIMGARQLVKTTASVSSYM